MPNWCFNNLNIHGDKDQLEAVIELMETKKSRFDFNAVLPQPEDLKGIISGGVTIDGVQYRQWREVNEEKIPVTPEEELELISKYAASNWYDWNCTNWGTKWNNTDEGVAVQMCSDTHLNYSFDTAWSPPVPVIDALAKKFPKLVFVLEYEEPGICFWGETEWVEGDVVRDEEGEIEWDEDSEEYIRK